MYNIDRFVDMHKLNYGIDLQELCNELLEQGDDIKYLMNYSDYLKLNLYMTLFDYMFLKEKCF